jgi:hypothetical protein
MKYIFKSSEINAVKAQDPRCNLIIGLSKLDRFFITLDKRIDRMSPAAQLLRDGVEVQILDYDPSDKSCTIGIRAREGITIRREAVMLKPNDIPLDKLAYQLPDTLSTLPLIEQISVLRKLYDEIDHMLGLRKLELKRGNSQGQRFKHHPLYQAQVIREEEYIELKAQRDLILKEKRAREDQLRAQWIESAQPEQVYFSEGLIAALPAHLDQNTITELITAAKNYSKQKVKQTGSACLYEYDEFKHETKPHFLKGSHH